MQNIHRGTIITVLLVIALAAAVGFGVNALTTNQAAELLHPECRYLGKWSGKSDGHTGYCCYQHGG